MKILFYGNCQLDSLHKKVDWEKSEPTGEYISCYLTELTEAEFQAKVSSADLIITQPINDNYREKPYLSTRSIINTKKPETRVAMFPSLWFHYYFSLEEDIEEKDFINLVKIQDKCRLEYPEAFFWDIHNIIWEQFRHRRLFYTANHPTTFLLEPMVAYLMGQVEQQTPDRKHGLVMDYNADPHADCIHRMVRKMNFQPGCEGKTIGTRMLSSGSNGSNGSSQK